MKTYKKTSILILTLLAIIQSTSISAFADVTEYQNPNMTTEESNAECEVIYKTTYEFSEEIPKYPDLEVLASGYEGVYDGKSHGIIVNCKTEAVTITYSTDGKNYVSKKPVYTDVGTYVTYYKVEKDGYTAVTGSEIVKITEAAINYRSADYSGLYDGKLHSIELSVQTKGCEILYSEDGVNYSSKKPEYKEPGTYVVYYKILKDNYATVIGSETVTIKKEDNINIDSKSQNNISQNNSNNFTNNNTDITKSDNISKVQTGDDSHILFYSVMFAASVLGLAKNNSRKEKRKP